MDLLEQGLGDALGDAAVYLALGEQRVEQPAGVVDGDVADEVDTVLVTTETPVKPTLSRWYTPVVMRWVIIGRAAPMRG